MTASTDFQTWLRDPEAQRTTQRAADRFGRDWDRGPVQQRFDAAMAALPEQSVEAVVEAVKGLFSDDDWVETLIGSLAEELAKDPYFAPPFRAINTGLHSGLIVFEDERLSIAAGVFGVNALAAKKSGARGPTSIGFSGRVQVLKFVNAGGARLSFWEAPEIDAGFTAGGAGCCRRVGERALVDGEILVIDGRRQGYVIEAARSNLLVLQAELAIGQAPVSVEYDSKHLCFIGCSATGDGSSRIQMIATLIRKLGCDGGFEAVEALLDHPDFFVRWHVMKELLGIDAGAALPHLKRLAARDPHADVRRAARSVLDRLAAPARASSKAA